MTPSKIRLHKQSRQLELQFGDETLLLSAELLRVHSPSAEVKGHGPNQAVLQYGKREVAITQIERAGNYAIKLVFSDGHDTGIYTWDYLYQLGKNQAALWQTYLDALHQAGKTRDAHTSVVRLVDPSLD
jgi:DUF971 family protein